MRTFLILIGLLMAGLARGAPVPIAPRPLAPALAAEIRNGADAAFGCQLGAAPLDAEAFVRCLGEAQRANPTQPGHGDAGFDAGLWYAGRGRLSALSAVAPKSVTLSNLQVAVLGLRWAEHTAGLTDDDVWRALHPSPSPRTPPRRPRSSAATPPR